MSIPGGDSDGTNYYLSFEAYDNAYKLNNSASGIVTIIKDASGPTVGTGVWSYPTSSVFLSGGNSITLLWNSGAITDAYAGLNQANAVVIEYILSSTGTWQTLASNIANS